MGEWGEWGVSESLQSLGSVELRSAIHILGCCLIVLSKGKPYKTHFLYPENYEAVLYWVLHQVRQSYSKPENRLSVW